MRLHYKEQRVQTRDLKDPTNPYTYSLPISPLTALYFFLLIRKQYPKMNSTTEPAIGTTMATIVVVEILSFPACIS
jgi:hypothetical protein